MRRYWATITTDAKPPYPVEVGPISASSWHVAASRLVELYARQKGKGKQHRELRITLRCLGEAPVTEETQRRRARRKVALRKRAMAAYDLLAEESMRPADISCPMCGSHKVDCPVQPSKGTTVMAVCRSCYHPWDISE